MPSGRQRGLKPFLGICVALGDNGVWDTVSKYNLIRNRGREGGVREEGRVGKMKWGEWEGRKWRWGRGEKRNLGKHRKKERGNEKEM